MEGYFAVEKPALNVHSRLVLMNVSHTTSYNKVLTNSKFW